MPKASLGRCTKSSKKKTQTARRVSSLCSGLRNGDCCCSAWEHRDHRSHQGAQSWWPRPAARGGRIEEQPRGPRGTRVRGPCDKCCVAGRPTRCGVTWCTQQAAHDDACIILQQYLPGQMYRDRVRPTWRGHQEAGHMARRVAQEACVPRAVGPPPSCAVLLYCAETGTVPAGGRFHLYKWRRDGHGPDAPDGIAFVSGTLRLCETVA
jgi:hypothetical protein